MSGDQRSLGRRVAAARARRGLSQSQLGALINRSEAWVSQVERDKRRIDRMSVLVTLSEALNVPLGELAPEEPVVAATTARGPSALSLVLVSSTAAPSESDAAITVDRATRACERAWKHAHASSYEELAALLAKYLPQMEAAARDRGGEDAARFAEALARTYHATAAALSKIGETSAAWVAADRAVAAAERSGNALLKAEGAFRLTLVFQGARWLELAEMTARTALEALESAPTPSKPALSLMGALTLQLAIASARAEQADAAYDFLDRAKTIAAAVGTGRNDHNTEFGPTNVQVHEVGIAVDLGDAGRALRVGETVDASALSPERQARLLIDLARAHAQRRSLPGAIQALTRAYEGAPEQVRSHPLTRAVIDALIAQGHGKDEQVVSLRDRLTTTIE